MSTIFAKRWIWAVATMSVAAAAGCGPGQQASQTVTADGSSTVYPITAAVAEEFQKDHPGVQVTVGVSGTGGGLEKFIAGEIDLCDASRAIKDSERDACAKAGIEFLTLEVAYDGLAVVAHPDNTWVDCLTVEQLKDIWRPESPIKKWSDVDASWPDEEIKLYGPGTDSGTFDYFTKEIVGEEKASRADYTPSEDDNVLVRGITADKYALGYFGYAYYAENKDSLKLIGVNGGEGCVTPSTETVRDGSYAPLSRPLFVYVKKAALARPHVASFVQFYLKHGDQLAEEVGYVPVSLEQQHKNHDVIEQALAENESAAPAGQSTTEN